MCSSLPFTAWSLLLPATDFAPLIRQVSLLPQAGTFTDQSCKTLCANSKLPLYALYCGTKCACSASIPDVAAEATGCDATATGATCGVTINLQYIHSGAATVEH
jgi:hypothetical protein